MSVQIKQGWAPVPSSLFENPDISDRAVRLFAVLYMYSFRHDRVTPSRKTLAETMGCSLPSIDKAKAELIELGVLAVERRKTDGVENLTNVYTLLVDPIGGSQNSLPGSQKNASGVVKKTRQEEPIRSNYKKAGARETVTPPMIGTPEANNWCDVCGVRGGKHRYDCEVAS
jgi:hypothetical protein